MPTVDQNLEALIRSSGANSLPDNPSSANYGPKEIKNAIVATSVILAGIIKNVGDVADGAQADADSLTEALNNFIEYVAETYATNSSAVHKAGEETITGAKTFTASVAIGSGSSDNSKALDIYFTTNLRGPVNACTILPANTGFTLGNGTDKRWNTGYFQYVDIGTSIKSGLNSWTLPSNSGVLAMTSDVGTAKSEAINHADAEVYKILDGTYLAYKAKRDADGNDIKVTYETKSDATAKVALSNLRSILGLASSSAPGLMGADDKSRLDALYELLGDEADSNAVVDTINEVLAIFDQYPEGATLLNALALKIPFSAIIDNLASNETSKPLSAYQGKVLNDRLEEVEENYVDHDDVFAAGMLQVVGYNQSTGKIKIKYNSNVMSITYNSSTGVLKISY